MRSLLRSFTQLAVSTLAGQLIGFFVLAVVARDVGAANLGAYGWASNVIPYLLLPLAGLVQIAQREIVRSPDQAATIGGRILPTIVLYSAVATLAAYFLAPLIAPTPAAATLLRILAATIPITLLACDWWLAGLADFGGVALANFLGQLFYGAAAVFLLTHGKAGVIRYSWLNVFGLSVTLAVITYRVIRLSGRPQLKTRVKESLRRLRRSSSYLASLMLVKIYYSADFILLGFLSSSVALGRYTVAYRVPFALLGLAAFWNSVIFTDAAKHSTDKLQAQLGLSLTLTFAVMLPLTVGSVITGHKLIVLMFGQTYGPAAIYFELLMVSVLVAFVGGVLTTALLAHSHEGLVSRGTAIGAALNVALNLFLIPLIGPSGSALATVAAEAAVFAWMWRGVAHNFGRPLLRWRRLLSSSLSTLVMATILLLFLSHAGLAWQVVVGAGSFGIAAVTTGVVRPAEIRAAVARRSLSPR
jgi:O-antigen/teichoic acid export membrane protein